MPEGLVLRVLEAGDVEPLRAILVSTGVFNDEEIAVALELLNESLRRPEGDYRVIVAQLEGVAGYACFGRAPFTDGTWDLYWIAVAPALHGRGIGAALTHEVEQRVAGDGGRLLLVETAGKPSYAPTRAAYQRLGYREVARLPDFYADGDDRITYAKRLEVRRTPGARA